MPKLGYRCPTVYLKVFGAWFLLTSIAFAQEREFAGKLEPELVPARWHQVSIFKVATETERNSIRELVGSGDQVFVGKLVGRLAFVLETAAGSVVLCVDANADGQVGVKEVFQLGPGPDDLLAGSETVLLPLSGLVYKSYPVKVYVYRKQREGERMVGESPFAFVQGHVMVDGKPLLVEYRFDPKTKIVPLDAGWHAMDVNGDGEIDPDPNAQPRETFHARNEVLVFHVGERYLLTKAVDLTKGEVVLQSCPASAYHTIELKDGTELPDVSFEDFSGKRRALSEFRGKYVLLDFWASWCGPCVKDLPHLSEVYERYHARGFEILGMNGDEDEARARKMIAEKSLVWPHATYSSIREFLERSFRIQMWPTYVMLDRDGKVVSSRQEDLRDEGLDRTLERLLP